MKNIENCYTFIHSSKYLVFYFLKNQLKQKAMQKFAIFFVFSALVIAFACKKDEQTERFKYLTTPVWEAESLLLNGEDASNHEVLGKFIGEAKFNKNGTGYLNESAARWRFLNNESQLLIDPDDLQVDIIANINKLDKDSLIISTSFIGLGDIRFSFYSK